MKFAPGSVELLVRIKPYNPKKGHRKRRFHTFFGYNFSEERGWCRMQSKIVHGGKTFDVEKYLLEVRNDDNDPDSEPVFDVCTIAEAKRIDAKEKADLEKRRTADKADILGGINRPVEMRGAGRDEEDEPSSVEGSKRGRKARASAEA